MSKPFAERTHKARVEKSNGSRSADDIRTAKNQTVKMRNLEAKAARIEAVASRVKRTASEQLAILDARFGVGVGAMKERAKLAKKIQA